jgi:hypothetical protein
MQSDFINRSLILPSFFTPATLFIFPSTNMVEIVQSVPFLAIANSTVGHNFAYSPPADGDYMSLRDDEKRVFGGPRTILSLLSTATASLGQILPIKAPYNHSSYSVQFHGPIVRCGTANSSVATRMENLLSKEMAVPLGTAKKAVNVYYGFVPAFDAAGETIALSKPRLQSPSNATNQLWITFLRYAMDSDGHRTRERHFQVCQLHNATFDLDLAWTGGVQAIHGSYDVLGEVQFPNHQSDNVSDMSQHAYSAFMWVLTDQLVGVFTWVGDRSNPSLSPEFGVIDTPLHRTSVLGSSDLDVFFDLNKKNKMENMDEDSTPLSDQRLQDKALARNRTLDVLIEELSFNMTVSLLHNELLT